MDTDSFPKEGLYLELIEELDRGYEREGNFLIIGGRKIQFQPAEMGYDISMEGLELGNTCDDYFLTYLSELFEGKDDQALKSLRSLSNEKRLIQAMELQSTIRKENRSYMVGTREVGFSRRFYQCTCPDWKYRRKFGGCKHIVALRLLDV